MTSLAFIAGVTPLAIASGAGSGSQNDIGTSVVGGMISATVFAIFFVPLFYVLVRMVFKARPRSRGGAKDVQGRFKFRESRSVTRVLRPRRVMAGALIAALVSGCASMAPTYVRPPAPIPAELPSGGAYPSGPTALVPAADLSWQEFFTDPKLKAVIAQALVNNRDLRVAIVNIQEARQQFKVQRAAELPKVGGTGAATYEHTPTDVALGSIGSSFPGLNVPQGGLYFQEFTASLGISDYEIDLWGRVRSLTKQALEQYLSTVEARRESQITLVSEVATDYLSYAADQQRLKVSQETLTSNQNTYELTLAKFNAGVVLRAGRASVRNNTRTGAHQRLGVHHSDGSGYQRADASGRCAS